MTRQTRILLADDDQAVLQIYSEILEHEGYAVRGASTGQQALDLAREERPDIVLLDRVLPDLGGIDVCRQIKADPVLADVFVVLFSGEATSAAHHAEGLDQGADEYINKATDPREFLARLRTIVRLRDTTAALRASERHYRRLIEILPDAVGLVGRDGRLVSLNERGVAMLGCHRVDEVLGKSVYHLSSPAEHERIRADLSAVLKNGVLRDAQYTFLRKSGEDFPVELNAALMHDSSPNGDQIVCVVRDITARKRVELELQKLALVVRNANEFVNLADLNGRMTFINECGSRMVGIPPEHVGNHHIHDVVAEASQEIVRTVVLPTLLERGRWEGELQYRHVGTGKLTDVHAMTFVVYEPGTDTPLYLANVSLDITERKRAEEHIRLLAQAVQSTDEMISITDPENRFTFVNRAFLDAYGYRREEVLGRTPEFLYSLKNPPGLCRETFEGTLAGGWSGELINCRKDGSEFPIALSTSVVKDHEGRTVGLMGVARNISARKRIERQSSAFSQLGFQLSAAVEPGQAGQIILDIASELFGWDAGYIDLYSPAEDKTIPMLAVDSISGRRVTVPKPGYPLNSSPLMRLVMEKGPRLVNREAEESDPIDVTPFGDKTRRSASRMYVPIHSSGSVIGVMSIQSYTPQAYSHEDLALLQSLANLCGAALHRIKVGEALREAESKYRSIFENAPEGLLRVTPAGKLLSANPALVRMFGFSSAGEMLETVTDAAQQLYVKPERRAELRRLMESQGLVEGFEVETRRRDGSSFWISLNERAVRDADGSVLYYEGTAQDVTERKRVQQRLADAMQLNLTILSASSLGIWVYRASGECIFANAAAGRIVGASPEHLLGQNFRQLPSWQRHGLLEMAQETMQSMKAQAREVYFVSSFGRTAWLECHMAPFTSGGESHLLLLANEITKRKRAEEELRRLPQRIIEAQETERLRVARELHDSVNQLIASAQMRLHGVEQKVNSISPSAGEILARSRDLLVKALEENRRIARDLRPSDLDQFGFTIACHNFCKQFRSRTNLKVSCYIAQFGKRLPPETELNLFRIVQEALNNVDKHARASRVQLRVSVGEDFLQLRIQDDGRGFDRGPKRPHKKRQGIGLSNIPERAASMGGTCEIESMPYIGTTITVRMPFSAA